jgi:hypothetical protein
MHVLVVNVGSSSLKLRFLDDRDQVVKSADLPVWVPDISDRDPSRALRDWPPPDVVGHRVVHGGTRFTGPVLVDRAVESALRELTDLAPLHLPKSLAAFDAVRAMLPEVAAVACFDTAFYASRPAEAATYAVPRGSGSSATGCAGTASTGYRTPPRLRRMEPDSDPPPDPFRIARFALPLFACLPGSGGQRHWRSR